MDFPEKYIAKAPPERQETLVRLRNILRETLIPLGFEECESYGMIGYVVPKSAYPAGYHCDTSLPLPFVNLASRKSGITLYHMGISADEALSEWWKNEYSKVLGKPDMGKGSLQFKKMEKIPYELIKELMSKLDSMLWIELYEKKYKK